MEKNQKKIVRIFCIFLILIVAIFTFHSSVEAAQELVNSQTTGKTWGSTKKNMPELNFGGETGLFAQDYSGPRNIYMASERFNLLTNKWKATMFGGIVYCSDYHAYVRYADYDDKMHFLYSKDREDYRTVIQGVDLSEYIEGDITFKTVEENYEGALEVIKKKYKDIIGVRYYKNPATSSETIEYKEIPLEIHSEDLKMWNNLDDSIKKALSYRNMYDDEDTFNAAIESGMSRALQKLFEELGVEKQNTKTEDTSTNEKTAIDKNNANSGITGIYGPKIIVMESTQHESDGYSSKALEDFHDSKLSFIFTACENAYGKEDSYARRYSLNDIQSAYWIAINQGEGPDNSADPDKLYPDGKVTEGGSELYEQAGKYTEFGEKFSATINSANAQVIADRANSYYIVGPYSINYTYYKDISYMKSLSINDILIYDEKHKNQLEIILEGGKGSGVSAGANGIEVEFPKSGQNFFVKFAATEQTGFPSVTLNARFEYISDTKVEEPTLLVTQANEYQYYGYCKIDGTEYKALQLQFRWRIDYQQGKVNPAYYKHTEGTHCKDGTIKDETTGERWDLHQGCQGEWIPEQRYNEWFNIPDQPKGDNANRWNTFTIYVPYIKLSEEAVAKDAQELLLVDKAEREYTVVNKSITIPIKMELGGYVWADEDGGKESISNGIKDSGEKKVPNVKVTLSNGAETTTNENGEYRFDNLDPMQQYSVTFTYNGQYYQPTTYVSGYNDENGWGKGTWTNNSNAKDNEDERNKFNIKFASIGSSPNNYKSSENSYNETFSKEQLLGMTLQYNSETKRYEYMKDNNKTAVIDEFGNLIVKESNDATTKKMIQYVKDCMMNAYTIDMYPVPSRFLIGEYYLYSETPDILRSAGIAGISMLYPHAYKINLGLDERPQADLAVNKDVQKVTLEINGQVHDYTYNSLEKEKLSKFHCDNCNYKGNNEELLNVNGQLKCPNCEFECRDCGHKGKAKDLVIGKDEYYGRDIQKCPKCGKTNINQKIENIRYLWDINVRMSDLYYNEEYSREIYKSDYLYKASMYNGIVGKVADDELEVYITYKIMVRNQSMSVQARVDEIVDYYDEDLTYIENRSYIEIKDGDNVGKYAVQADYNETKKESKSIYGNGTETKIEGYNNLYIRGLGENAQKIDDKGNKTEEISEGIYLKDGEVAYVYLTFCIDKENKNDEAWVKLDEIIENGSTEISKNKYDVGKENIVEINGYSTKYGEKTYIPNVVDNNGKPKDVVGTIAGIVDRDSNPGNLNPNDVPKNSKYEDKDDNNYQNFEDDTDKAPNIRIILNRDDESTRVISGSVWEDSRTQEIDVTTTGDGYKDEKGTLINGVTVQLVELLENGQEYVWREFGNIDGTTGTQGGTGLVSSEYPIINAVVNGNDIKIVEITEDPSKAYPGQKLFIPNYEFGDNKEGSYAFKSFMPGKYVVRFIYGDTTKTVLPESLGGLNTKSYNGQDYKSTTYQKGVEQKDANGNNKTYTWREESTWVNGQEIIGRDLTVVYTFKDDASNNETANAKLNEQEQKGYLYDITASDAQPNVSDAKDIERRRNQVNDYSDNDVTNYIAEVLASHKEEYRANDYKTANDKGDLLEELIDNTKMRAETGLMVIELEYDREETENQKADNKSTYKIQNVDLGLEERPKAQLAIDKEVTNIKVTLADGSILFDAKDTATNVLWKDHKEYFEGFTELYDGKMLNTKKLINLEKIREINSNKFGLIQLSMDEELMHGATIEIAYQVKVSNIGEVDYKDNHFYYTGIVKDKSSIVKTIANQVIDYVANNLQFNASRNSNWSVIKQEELMNTDNTKSLVNNILKSQIEKYNTIIVTDKLSKELVPELADNNNSSVTVPLVLTQLITSENDTDDLTYNNLVEIVKTSNTVGRRMEFSVVGNQNPSQEPQELDSDRSEEVMILPPFGNGGIYIIITIVTLISIAIIICGTIFIKKKVLRK